MTSFIDMKKLKRSKVQIVIIYLIKTSSSLSSRQRWATPTFFMQTPGVEAHLGSKKWSCGILYD